MCRTATPLLALLLVGTTLSAADPLPQLPDEILVLPPVSRYGRSAIPVDPIQELIATDKWRAPQAGDKVIGLDGKDRQWSKLSFKEGAIQHPSLNGGYAFLGIESLQNRIVLLEAAGPVTTIVNGEPRAGDLYSNGLVTLPILLRKGVNHLLFHVGRGSLRVKFHQPTSLAQFHHRDHTVPDLLLGQPVNVEAALPVLNNGMEPLADLQIEATYPGSKPVLTPIPSVLPLSIRKVGFRVRGEQPNAPGKLPVAVRLLQRVEGVWRVLDKQSVMLEVKKSSATHRRTFRSEIDGSVQYYAVVPALADGDRRPGLVLSLHGASVEGFGQAASYSPKPGLHIVAPTNRRPYGFDWEDWGRWDAIEVLERAQRELDTDRSRTFLTGHSMGGHGTWHLGVTFPDRFAAIGPSAGWVSMWSYAGLKRVDWLNPVDELILRAANASDTLALVRNAAVEGVYVLHGDADDNVPIEQARTMRKALAEFHPDFVYHEEPGVGHWWGKPGVSGSACVDWPAMFQFFESHRIPDRKTSHQVAFATASPAASASCQWVRIEAQSKCMMLSTVDLKRDLAKRRIEGTTANVARLSLDLEGMEKGPLTIKFDGVETNDIPWPESGDRLVLAQLRDKWKVVPAVPSKFKSPDRCGPFKEAFRRRVQFVYGTRGTPEENAWSLAKARYDAEQFWYRGNGSIDVVADSAFDARAEPNRNVILYGHAQSNSAWVALLKDSPIQVNRGSVAVGNREEKGDNLAALFVRPRPGSHVAMVGVVAGTGLTGLRVTDRIPYFVSGVGLPDWMLIGSESFSQGRTGVRAAGYFGMDWALDNGESAWRK